MTKLWRDRRLLSVHGHDFHPGWESSVPDTLPEFRGPVEPIVPEALVGTALATAIPVVVQSSLRMADARRVLESAGVEILEPVPHSAWLVRVQPERARMLSQLPGVTWTGAFTPAHVVSRELVERLADPTCDSPVDPQGFVRVELRLLPGLDMHAYMSAIAAMPGVTLLSIDAPAEGSHSAFLGVQPSDLRATIAVLGRLQGAAAVEPRDVPMAHVDDSVWQIQTGISQPGATSPGYDVTAKLFRNGITGRGILIGIADDGLENDACMFRYGSVVNEAAWPIGPSAEAPDAIPLEEPMPDPALGPAPLRTRDRKVVAYYVERNAAAYASTIQHGTATSAVAVGDDLAVLAARPLVRDVGERQFVPSHQPGATWQFGDELRPDLAARVDSPLADEFSVSNRFAVDIEHHQAGDGIAPGAQLVFQDIGDASGSLSFTPTMGQLMSQSERTGATAFSVSFGGDPCTNCYLGTASSGDDAAWRLRDIIPFVSAGNDGFSGAASIGAGLAHAKSAVTAGATEGASSSSTATTRSGEDVADFSSRGPKSGGMLAPELVAPGIVRVPSVMAVQPEDGSGSGNQDCGGVTLGLVTGTSFSAPTLAGAAALVQQYFLDGYYPSGQATPADALRPTNALVRAILVNSARDIAGAYTSGTGSASGHRPSFGQGWGSPRLDDTLYFVGDPTDDDPFGDTERAGLLVLTDTPNGLDPIATGGVLSVEPGGSTRDLLVANFRSAIEDGLVHESLAPVSNPDPTSLANELRFTLAWSDPAGSSPSIPQVNDLDLEVISPGPDGILETSGSVLVGDDEVYRSSSLNAWSLGSTLISVDQIPQSAAPPFTDFVNRDALNTIENVFIPAGQAYSGDWRIRVIGYDVPGNGGGTNSARPNYVLGDRPPVFDTDGDGVLDTDAFDTMLSWRQGYALIASGPVLSNMACLAIARLRTSASTRPCLGDTIPLDASPSSSRNCSGLLEYQFESPAGSPIPGGNWDASPTRDFTPSAVGVVDVFVRVRCSTDPSCTGLSARLRSDVQRIPMLDFPSAVAVAPEGDCALRVSWLAATTDAPPVSYDLYRATSLPVPLDAAHLLQAGLSVTTFLDAVPWGSSYAYRVIARVPCKEEPNAAGDSALIAPRDLSAPTFAGIIDTRDLGFCQVEVTWDESTARDDCSGIAGYDVYRDHGVAHAGRTRVASGVTGSPYIDTTPGNGTWIYVVRAVNGAGLDDGNSVFQQESEGSCTNDFPRDAGLDRENGLDPPRADRFRSDPSTSSTGGPDAARLRLLGMAIDIAWIPSPDEGGLYPVTYSVLRGTLGSLQAGAYDHALVTPDACGIPIHSFSMPDQLDGISRYYLIVSVSGDNATYGYDSFGREIAASPVCE